MKLDRALRRLCYSTIPLFALASTTPASAFPRHIFHREPSQPPAPLFTGPLLAPAAQVVTRGHFNIEPYIYFTTTYGLFGPEWKTTSIQKNYSTLLQVPVQIGLTSWMDFTFTPQAFYNFTRHAQSGEFGDLPFAVDIQLYDEGNKDPWPSIRLSLQAKVPLGKYDRLNPRKLGTDGVGSGSWAPSVLLVFGRLFEFKYPHYLSAHLALLYTIPNSVHVSGLNVYGGGQGTHGSVRPGDSFSIDLGLEFSVTHNWVLATDVLYQHFDRSPFHGHAGKNSLGLPNVVGLPSQEQFSIAPAIEYNWNEHLGLITGVWWTFAGRNTPQFASSVTAFNVYY
jgi:hypothetical protein